jgi:Clp amino terminal domain, pathogenicity island component
VVQRSEQASRVLELARAEAEGFGHRYLGPEHLVLGILREGGSGASRVLGSFGVTLAGARTELRRLADRGVAPGPRPSDADLLGSLGIDLEVIRRSTEQAFGSKAVEWAIREAPGRDDAGLGGYHARRCGTHRCSSPRWGITPAGRPRRSASA